MTKINVKLDLKAKKTVEKTANFEGDTPTGTIEITENGEYDVASYANANVNVEDVPAVVEPVTVNPTTSQQVIEPKEGVDGFSKVTVNAVDNTIDSNIVAENIKKDVEILGVTGEYEAPKVPDYTGSYTITENGTIAISGKKATEDITVEVPSVQPVLVEANVTSFYGGSDIIRPEQGVDGFSQINITGIYDSNIQPYNIKKGITILGCPGNYDPNSDYIDYETFFNSFQNKYLDGEKLVQFMHKYNLELDYSESGSVQHWTVNYLSSDNGLQDSVLFGYDFYNSSCDYFELEGGGSIYSSEVESEEDFISKVNDLSSVSLSSPDSSMKSPYKFKVVIVKEYDSTLEVPLSEIVALFVNSHH